MSEILEHLYASEFADFLMAPLDANQWFQFVVVICVATTVQSKDSA
jgi:hypothetical protein